MIALANALKSRHLRNASTFKEAIVSVSFLKQSAAAILVFVCCAPAFAQNSNPFIPFRPIDKAGVERVVTARIAESERRMEEKFASAASSGMPGAPGISGTPGTPGTPGAAGLPVGGPGGAVQMGVPQMAMMEPEKTVFETSGLKFVGCINGKHVFRGGQISAADIRIAVKAGQLRSC